MSKIRVAIFSGYGAWSVPKKLKDKLEGLSSIEFRVKLAELIDDLPVNCEEEELRERYRKLEKRTGDFYLKVPNSDVVYLMDTYVPGQGLSYPTEVTIKDVDTALPWRIEEYDGAEGIEVFRGCKVVDEKYNLCTW